METHAEPSIGTRGTRPHEMPPLPLLRAAWSEHEFGEEPESDFETAAAAPPEDALTAWRAEVEASRAVIAVADSLDEPGSSGLPSRFWLVKTLNEYARHNGHADVVRELIDGSTCE